MYLAPVIDSVLESKKINLIGTPTYHHITNVLNRAFLNTPTDFKFRFETYDDYEKEDYSISGLYDMEKDVKYIILHFSNQYKKFNINKKLWREFKFSISQACQHEAIHQTQWQHRDSDDEPCTLEFRNTTGTVSEEKEYLSDLDEIDAYGHDIAMEIKYYYPRLNPLVVLKTLDSRKKVWSYGYYKKTFKGDDWSYIKKRLLKKAYLWLPHVTV